MKKAYTSLIAQIALIAVLFSFGVAAKCDAQSIVGKTIDYSEQAEAQLGIAITAYNLAVGDNLVTPEENARVVPKLEKFKSFVGSFRKTAVGIRDVYGRKIPQSALDQLNAAFDEKITGPLLELLQEVKLLKNAAKAFAAIAVVRYVVLNISQSLGKKETVAELRRTDEDFKEVPISDTTAVILYEYFPNENLLRTQNHGFS